MSHVYRLNINNKAKKHWCKPDNDQRTTPSAAFRKTLRHAQGDNVPDKLYTEEKEVSGQSRITNTGQRFSLFHQLCRPLQVFGGVYLYTDIIGYYHADGDAIFKEAKTF